MIDQQDPYEYFEPEKSKDEHLFKPYLDSSYIIGLANWTKDLELKSFEHLDEDEAREKYVEGYKNAKFVHNIDKFRFHPDMSKADMSTFQLHVNNFDNYLAGFKLGYFCVFLGTFPFLLKLRLHPYLRVPGILYMLSFMTFSQSSLDGLERRVEAKLRKDNFPERYGISLSKAS